MIAEGQDLSMMGPFDSRSSLPGNGPARTRIPGSTGLCVSWVSTKFRTPERQASSKSLETGVSNAPTRSEASAPWRQKPISMSVEKSAMLEGLPVSSWSVTGRSASNQLATQSGFAIVLGVASSMGRSPSNSASFAGQGYPTGEYTLFVRSCVVSPSILFVLLSSSQQACHPELAKGLFRGILTKMYAYVREITAAAGDPSFLRMTTHRLEET